MSAAPRGNTPLIALKPRPAPEDNQPKPRPLTPASSSTDLTTVQATPSTDSPVTIRNLKIDLKFLRQVYKHDVARLNRTLTIINKYNNSLERNIRDLRQQIDDLRAATISNLAAQLRVSQ